METIINTRTKYCLRKLKEGNKVQLPFHNDITPKRTDETRMKESKSLFKNYSPDNFWVKLLFLISAVSLTFLLSIAPSSIYSYIFLIPSVILGLIIWLYLVFKKNLLQKIWKKTSKLICGIALVLSCCTAWIFGEGLFNNISSTVSKVSLIGYDFIINYVETPEFLNEHNAISQYLPYVKTVLLHTDVLTVGFIAVLCLITVYSLYLLWKFLLTIIIPAVHNFIRGLDKVEKCYLYIMGVIAVIAIPILYISTSIFYLPTDLFGNFMEYSGLFGADTGNLVETNAFGYLNAGENDIRQLLFGLFALPFSIIAFIVSKLLFFIPNVYSIVLGILQVCCVSIIALLISHLLKTKKITKILVLLVFTISYPTLLFSITLEQYVFATFWLVLFIYSACTSEKFKEWFFIGACGTLTTSIVTFPLLSKRINVKKYVSVAATALILLILSGRLYYLCTAIPELINLSSYTSTGNSFSFGDRILQYLNFVSTTLFTPNISISEGLRYSQSAELFPNIVGIIILAIVILGFILNRKSLYAKICIGWVIFSFIILCVIGWDSAESALQSFYFAWAFISLAYLAIHKLCEHHPRVEIIILICLIAAMLIVNIPGIIDVIQFGIQYYPGLVIS